MDIYNDTQYDTDNDTNDTDYTVLGIEFIEPLTMELRSRSRDVEAEDKEFNPEDEIFQGIETNKNLDEMNAS